MGTHHWVGATNNAEHNKTPQAHKPNTASNARGSLHAKTITTSNCATTKLCSNLLFAIGFGSAFSIMIDFP